LKNWITWLPGYHALAKRLEAEYNQRTHQLQVDHGISLARADGAEQEVEWLKKDNAALRKSVSKANLDIARYCGELVELREENKQYVDKNTALKAQVEGLVAAKQPAPIPARPGAKKKGASE
jgi:chromosome segregation ATPase